MSQTNNTQTTPSGIPVTYKQISSYAFGGAMEKLKNAPFKDGGRCAYLVKKMNQAIDKIMEKVRKEYREDLMEKFAERDSEGKYTEENFKVQEAMKEEFTVALEEFENRSAVIERPKFFAQDIREAHLTAMEQEAIDPILDDSAFETMKATGQGPAIRRA